VSEVEPQHAGVEEPRDLAAWRRGERARVIAAPGRWLQGLRRRALSSYLNLEQHHDDALAVIESASVRYRIAVGPIAGRKTLRLQGPSAIGTPTEVTTPLTATRDGFSLNASVACGAGERKKLERLCRFVARSPLALYRSSHDGDTALPIADAHGRTRDVGSGLSLPSCGAIFPTRTHREVLNLLGFGRRPNSSKYHRVGSPRAGICCNAQDAAPQCAAASHERTWWAPERSQILDR